VKDFLQIADGDAAGNCRIYHTGAALLGQTV
jgi:hypothetical protein